MVILKLEKQLIVLQFFSTFCSFCIAYFLYTVFYFFKHCADIGVNDLSIPAQSRKIDQRLDFVA